VLCRLFFFSFSDGQNINGPLSAQYCKVDLEKNLFPFVVVFSLCNSAFGLHISTWTPGPFGKIPFDFYSGT